jgi:hypothetical protein
MSGEAGKPAEGQTVSMKQRKARIARRFITRNAPKIRALTEQICAGDTSTLQEYGSLVGPVVIE